MVWLDLKKHIGETVRMIGEYVAAKYVPTKKGYMAFGAFEDINRDFFDTTHFPQSFKAFLFNENGAYLIKVRVVEEFGIPSIEVEKMAKLPIVIDPRSD